MSTGKLSDVQLKAWIKAGEPLARADGEGLTFTLSSRGTASWILRYRLAGTQRELTLGRYPDVALAEARRLARHHRARIQQGEDVSRTKQREKQASASAWTFARLVQDYKVKVFPTLAVSTRKGREQHLNLACQRLGGRPARDIDPADLVLLIENIGSRSRSMAEVVFTAVAEVFKHGLARHVVTTNPCAGLSVTAICGKSQTRQRVMLTESELRLVLEMLPELGIENALPLKILLATGVRIGELTRAEWTHIDWEAATWWIPPDHIKTQSGSAISAKIQSGFTIPLVPTVVDWFRALEPLACGSRYVLPTRRANRARDRGGDAPLEQRSLNANVTKLCHRLGDRCRYFTPHDLRATMRSWLSAFGIPVPVAERCLNHSLGGLLAIYDKHDYLLERRAALEQWTAFLLACEAQVAANVILRKSA